MYFVYILISLLNSKTYTGTTGKLPENRLFEHNLKCNSWTSNNGPFRILYYESYYCKKDAIHRELFLKSGVGNKLVKIIKDNW